MDYHLTARTATLPAGGHTLALFQDGVHHDLLSARAALRTGDTSRADADLRRAQRTLLELIRALDPRVSPDLSLCLSSCYQSIFDAVSEALAHPSQNAVDRAVLRLERVREAWSDARSDTEG